MNKGIKTAGIAALLLASVSLQAAEEAKEEQGPGPAAANMMAQFYDVTPKDVKVDVQEREGRTFAHATANGHACNLEMSPAPEYVRARNGWLIASINCQQGPDGKYRENNPQ
jgi:hypothetical protein